MQSRHIVSTAIAQPTGGKTAIFPASNNQVELYSARLINKSGSACDLALIRRQAPSSNQFFTYLTGSPGTATDVTAAIQAGTSEPLAVTSTNNSGFIVQCSATFSMIGLQIGTAAGSGYTYGFNYWNGSAWSTLTLVGTPVLTSTGDIYYFFIPPADWATGGPAGLGLSSGKYAVQVLATTAGATTAPAATNVWTGQMIDFAPQVATNGSLLTTFQGGFPLMLNQGEGIQGYFSVPAATNTVIANYSIQG
jgi:hypothetical protein